MVASKCIRCTGIAVKNGYCQKHAKTKRYTDKVKLASYQVKRKKRTRSRREYALANDSRMFRIAKSWLLLNPFCVRCLAKSEPLRYARRNPAVHCDHIKPVAKFPELKYDTANLQSLCLSCHSIKTQHEKTGIYYDYANCRVYTDEGVSEIQL